MIKKVTINIVKILFAVGLIYYLVNSGKLEFSLLLELMNKPITIIISLILMQVIIALISFRLNIFLSHKTNEGIAFRKLFSANWIGLFFNSVLPGSVSGDLVKIFYIQKENKKLSKKFLLLSVFIDRVVGLMGLIILGGFFSLINYGALSSLSTDVNKLALINILLMSVIVISLVFLYLAPNLPLYISSKVKIISFLKGPLNKLEEIWKDLLMFKNKLIGQIIISMGIQSLAVFIFWFITSPFADNSFNLTTAFSITPIGFISIAIPIAPAGLGVGHVVFERLLAFFSITNGASLFNLYFFVVIISNLTGVIPYLFHGIRPNKEIKK